MRKSLAICVTLFLVFIFYAHSSEASVVAFTPEQLQPIQNVNNIYELIDRWTEDGALEKIEDQLKSGFKLDAINPEEIGPGYGQTPLTEAIRMVGNPLAEYAADVRADRYDVVTLILKYNPDVNFRNKYGETPLHIAVSKGDIDLTSELIKRGADINAIVDDGQETSSKPRVIEEAISRGENSFKILMAKGAKYDPEKILNLIFQFGLPGQEEVCLETFLSYPIEIPDSYRDRLASYKQEKNRNRLQIASIIERHMDLMNAAKKSGKPPKLLFERKPVLFKQVVPPLENPEIVTAVLSGDLAKVKSLLDHGADVNAVSRVVRQSNNPEDYSFSASPILHIAIKKKYDDIAELLIDKSAKIDMTDAGGQTPLFLAVSVDNLKIVQKLVENGADVNQPELKYGMTPLENTSDIKIINFLLDKKADPNHISKYGSVMHNGSYAGNEEILKTLIAHGGNINLVGYEGNTPLQRVLDHDSNKNITLDQVKNIVQLGADLKIKNAAGFTAYDIAIEKDRDDIADYLKQSGAVSGDQESVLNMALYNGDVDTVKRVLDDGYPAKDKYAHIVISGAYHVSPAKQLAMLKLLAEHGADLKSSGWAQQSQTLLHRVGDPDIIDFLVSQGVDVNETDTGRLTPLHIWAREGNVAAVKALIKHKAFPNSISDQKTPLCEALEGPTNKQPVDGPPIHWGVDELPYLEIIRILMAAGADPTLMNEHHCRPYYHVGPEYESFRKKADQIISESKVPVSRKADLVIKKTYKLIPAADIQFLFQMVSTGYLNKNEAEKYQPNVDAKGVCNLPVIKAAQKLYEANPESAPDFKSFLNELTLRGVVATSNINGVNMLPDSRYSGYNLLHMAAHYGDIRLVNELLDLGVDPAAIDDRGNTVIYYATNSALTSNIKNVKDVMEIVKILMDHGVDINAQNTNGETALLTSSFMSFGKDQPVPHYQLISYLLDHGADPKLNRYGQHSFADTIQYALKMATQHGQPSHQEPYKILLEKLQKQGIEPQLGTENYEKSRDLVLSNPLLKAIRENNIEIVKDIIKAGADINQPIERVYPILASVDGGDRNFEITKLLIDKGANLDIRSRGGTLISQATSQPEHEKTIRYLIDHGAKAHSIDLLIMSSIQSEYLTPSARRSLELILQQGMNPNICRGSGSSPLSMAVQSKNLEAVELLVQYGAVPLACPQGLTKALENTSPEIRTILGKSSIHENPSIISDLVAITDQDLGTCTIVNFLIPEEYRNKVPPKIIPAPHVKLTPAQRDYVQGLLYYKGKSVPKDDVKAVEFFLLSAKAGDSMAQHDLAYMYSVGQGVEKDAKKAFEWMKKSAEQGNHVAQDDLGVMYGDGIGTPQNWVESYRWIYLSAQNGNIRAKSDLEYVKARMTPEQFIEAENLLNTSP